MESPLHRAYSFPNPPCANLSSKVSNLFLNISLVVVIILATVLVYAFSQRVSAPRPDPKRLENPGNFLGEIIQVEVMNGTHVSGLANQITDHLQRNGFDVVETGNYTSQTVEKTVIMDRIGNLDAAEQVALALGLAPERITEELKPEYFIDATVVVGADYKSLLPFADQLSDLDEERNTESEPE